MSDRRVRTNERGNDSLCCPQACVCCVVPTTYAQLSNDKTRWKHNIPCLTRHITQSLWCWLSLDTYHHTPHKSIHQAVVMTMSKVAAGEPSDRCVRQMVPSAEASGRHRTPSLSFALTSYPPYLPPLSLPLSCTITAPHEKVVSQKCPFFID